MSRSAFIGWWRGLDASDAAATGDERPLTLRFFDKQEGYFQLFGDDARYFAANVFRTASELKSFLAGPDEGVDPPPDPLPYVNVRSRQFALALPSLLADGAEVRVYTQHGSTWQLDR